MDLVRIGYHRAMSRKFFWQLTPLVLTLVIVTLLESKFRFFLKNGPGRVFTPLPPNQRITDSPLCAAILGLDTATALLLIANAGTDINAVDRIGQTPLIMAVLTGNRRVMHALLARRDVNINACDNNGRTALLRAAIGQNEIMLQMLLERSDLNINATDNWGFTALNCASQRGYYGYNIIL